MSISNKKTQGTELTDQQIIDSINKEDPSVLKVDTILNDFEFQEFHAQNFRVLSDPNFNYYSRDRFLKVFQQTNQLIKELTAMHEQRNALIIELFKARIPKLSFARDGWALP